MLTQNYSPPNPDKAIRYQRTEDYPHEVWFFLACLLGLVIIFRFLAFVCSKVFRRRLPLSQDPEKVSNSQPTSRVFSFQNLPLALVNVVRIVAFRLTLDFGSFSINLTEVVLTLMYIAALFTWTFINTTDVSGIKFDETYWSSRAGALIASQLPLITALGTKNNVISWITGVQHEKLNYLHRMAARVVFVLAWVHGGSKMQSGLAKDLGQTWLIWGILALSCLTLLCLISIRPVRVRAYEIFFFTHLVLVLLFLIGAYNHTKEFSFQTYVWPSFIIWGVDRILRALRLILFNLGHSGKGSMDATPELVTPDLVRLTLKRPQHFKWSPGQVVYLTTPEVSTFAFEAHPFTIASYDFQASCKTATETTLGSTRSDTSVSESSPKSYWKDLVFFINVKEGFTKRLAQIAAQKRKFKVYMDGPYGLSHDSSSYNTIVFIAGNTGVSYTLPLLLDLIECVRKGKSICQRATFVWCIRDSEHIRWISDVLEQALALAPESLKIDIRIFVTAPSKPSDCSDLDYESVEKSGSTSAELTPTQTPISEKKIVISPSDYSVLTNLSSVKISSGRPFLAELLAEEAEATNGTMWVTVCGSQSLVKAVRKGLSFPVSGPSAVLRGGASVSLHVESFGYT